jgi:hypothetical protein
MDDKIKDRLSNKNINRVCINVCIGKFLPYFFKIEIAANTGNQRIVDKYRF